MFERFRAGQALLAGVCIAMFLSACAGKDDVAPADVEKQAFEDLRTAVRAAVDDPAREAEAVRLVNQLERDLEALRARIADRRSYVRALNADYETPREDFEAYLARVAKEIRENRQIVSETQQALSKAITREEGDAIAKSHTRAMNAAIASIQAI
jgi:hypothetical protein